MKPDDPICLCFHVTRRKVEAFIRVEKPARPSQLNNCFGAGTGCGWCRPYLQRLWEQARRDPTTDGNSALSDLPEVAEMSLEEYALQRANYVRSGEGTPPPGATPIE